MMDVIKEGKKYKTNATVSVLEEYLLVVTTLLRISYCK